MSIFRQRLDLFYRKGDDVIVYPVPKEQVAAYLSAGGSGSTVRGLFVDEDVLVETDAGPPVQSPEAFFETTAERAASIMPRESSIEFEGERYTVVGKSREDPGFVRCWLEA